MLEGLTKLFIYGVILVWFGPVLIVAGAGLLVIIRGIVKWLNIK